jgi:hypothetical protein
MLRIDEFESVKIIRSGGIFTSGGTFKVDKWVVQVDVVGESGVEDLRGALFEVEDALEVNSSEYAELDLDNGQHDLHVGGGQLVDVDDGVVD